ncbi:MAG: ABC transporter substrate binding protein [Desulfobacteraceae bacterium]
MLLSTCSLLTNAAVSHSKDTYKPQILLLNSYHQGYKGTDDIVRGFSAAIAQAFPHASIKTEYLDSKYYSGSEYDEILHQLLRHKYEGHHFDLIVASDDFAFNIVEKYYNDFFSQLPVVFCGTNAFNVKRLVGRETFVGVDERPSFKESIDLVFRLRPETKHIVVIHDDSITGQINSKAFRSEARDFNKKAEFKYLAGLPMETLIEQIQKLTPDTTAFYFASFVKTVNGKHYSSGEALEILSTKSPVPIFGGWEFSLNHGIIGGKLINLVKHGSLAGHLAVEILKGKSPTSLPKLSPSPNSFMFDDKMLKRFKIKDAVLPSESTIINRPPTVYQKYRAEIFISLSILLAMIIVGSFVALYKSRSRLQRAFREQLKTKNMLRNRTSTLEATNKELDAFAYTVSHDLRAPLRHINGFIELLQKRAGTALDEQCRHHIEVISDSAQNMGLLIDDLLSFSRMRRQAMSLRQVDLGNLVHDVIQGLETDTAGRTIDWRIGDLPMVNGDAAMLRSVLTNLIANALKFTQTREQARIEIDAIVGHASEVVIFVRDNGVGFDMTYADKLFGVFQRLHRADEFEGTGIGLANVRRIIARHGGRTWAKGKPDQGAAFYFALPQAAKEAAMETNNAP